MNTLLERPELLVILNQQDVAAPEANRDYPFRPEEAGSVALREGVALGDEVEGDGGPEKPKKLTVDDSVRITAADSVCITA